MSSSVILQQRLQNQLIGENSFKTPGEVVKWLGAVQAQDYLGTLWALGLRMENVTEADIEKAIAEKTIVRTWPMRGTLHFVAAEDVRWMLALLTPRIIARTAGLYRQLELSEAVFNKSKDALIKAMEGGKQLQRNALYQTLEEANINTTSQRGFHILGHLAQKGVICFGPRQGKQQTFVLLDEWLPASATLSREEALASIARRYFTSHGPAQLPDFAWWTGLTLTDAKVALEIVKTELHREVVNQKIFWSLPNSAPVRATDPNMYLLPGFDEYLLGYTDRSDALNTPEARQAHLVSNGLLSPTIVTEGEVVGIWKRTLKKDKVVVAAKTFEGVSKMRESAIHKACKLYSEFLKMKSGYELALN